MNEDIDYLHVYLLFESIDGFILNSMAEGQDLCYMYIFVI